MNTKSIKFSIEIKRNIYLTMDTKELYIDVPFQFLLKLNLSFQSVKVIDIEDNIVLIAAGRKPFLEKDAVITYKNLQFIKDTD